MGLLDHKTAVVTGGNSGIGLATAQRFIAEGATRVFVTGRRQAELDAAATQLGPRAVVVRGDVGVPSDLERLYAAVAAAGDGLDIVVANAGFTRVARLGAITDADLDALLTTNVKGVVYTVQQALPLLNDGASIILIGSSTADRGRPGMGIYAATKAAVRSLARTWANELADRNIRVNVVVAGSTATPAAMPWPGKPIPASPSTISVLVASRAFRWDVSPTLSRSPTPQYFWPAICPASSPDPPSVLMVVSTKSERRHP